MQICLLINFGAAKEPDKGRGRERFGSIIENSNGEGVLSALL